MPSEPKTKPYFDAVHNYLDVKKKLGERATNPITADQLGSTSWGPDELAGVHVAAWSTPNWKPKDKTHISSEQLEYIDKWRSLRRSQHSSVRDPFLDNPQLGLLSHAGDETIDEPYYYIREYAKLVAKEAQLRATNDEIPGLEATVAAAATKVKAATREVEAATRILDDINRKNADHKKESDNMDTANNAEAEAKKDEAAAQEALNKAVALAKELKKGIKYIKAREKLMLKRAAEADRKAAEADHNNNVDDDNVDDDDSDNTSIDSDYPYPKADDTKSPLEDVTVHHALSYFGYMLIHAPTNDPNGNPRHRLIGGSVVDVSITKYTYNQHGANVGKCKIHATDDGGWDLRLRGNDEGAWRHRVVLLEAKRELHSFKDGSPQMTDKLFGQLTREAVAAALDNYTRYKTDESITIIYSAQRFFRFFRFPIPKTILEELNKNGCLHDLEAKRDSIIRVKYTKLFDMKKGKHRRRMVRIINEIVEEIRSTDRYEADQCKLPSINI